MPTLELTLCGQDPLGTISLLTRSRRYPPRSQEAKRCVKALISLIKRRRRWSPLMVTSRLSNRPFQGRRWISGLVIGTVNGARRSHQAIMAHHQHFVAARVSPHAVVGGESVHGPESASSLSLRHLEAGDHQGIVLRTTLLTQPTQVPPYIGPSCALIARQELQATTRMLMSPIRGHAGTLKPVHHAHTREFSGIAINTSGDSPGWDS